MHFIDGQSCCKLLNRKGIAKSWVAYFRKQIGTTEHLLEAKFARRKEEQSILDGCITIGKYGNIKKLDSKKGMGVE